MFPEGLTPAEAVLDLLREEAKLREKRAAAERLKQARFPAYKGFDEFDTDFQKGISDKELEQLSKLEWAGAWQAKTPCTM
jgi:DNA replication protein DnaC